MKLICTGIVCPNSLVDPDVDKENDFLEDKRYEQTQPSNYEGLQLKPLPEDLENFLWDNKFQRFA